MAYSDFERFRMIVIMDGSLLTSDTIYMTALGQNIFHDGWSEFTPEQLGATHNSVRFESLLYLLSSDPRFELQGRRSLDASWEPLTGRQGLRQQNLTMDTQLAGAELFEALPSIPPVIRGAPTTSRRQARSRRQPRP